jgi:hypothetical protein
MPARLPLSTATAAALPYRARPRGTGAVVPQRPAAERNAAIANGFGDMSHNNCSLASWFATRAVPDADIAATSRHKPRDMVARYTRIADPFRSGVAGKVEL